MAGDLLQDGSGVREEGVGLRWRLPAEYLRVRILQPLAHLHGRRWGLREGNMPLRCSGTYLVHASLAPLRLGRGGRMGEFRGGAGAGFARSGLC